MTITFTASKDNPTDVAGPAQSPYPLPEMPDCRTSRYAATGARDFYQMLFRFQTQIDSSAKMLKGLELIVTEAVQVSPTPANCILTFTDSVPRNQSMRCCLHLKANRRGTLNCAQAREASAHRSSDPSLSFPCLRCHKWLAITEPHLENRDVSLHWILLKGAAINGKSTQLFLRLRQAFDKLEEEQRIMMRAEKLLCQHQSFVQRIARKFFLPGTEMEDLLQEGRIGLYKAICNYDPGHGLPFENYASMCIRNEIHTAFKQAARHARLETVSLEAVETVGEEPRDHDLTPEDHVCSKADAERIRRLVQSRLHGLERQVFLRYLEGVSPAEISESLQLTGKQVDNAFQRAKKRLRKTPFEELM